MRQNFLMVVLVVASFVGSCSSAQKFNLSTAEPFTEKNLIRVHGDELIAKKNKWNVEAYITNSSDKAIIINLNEIRCFRGGEQGVIGHARFGIGERIIDFAP